jgi:hypothetical protein
MLRNSGNVTQPEAEFEYRQAQTLMAGLPRMRRSWHRKPVDMPCDPVSEHLDMRLRHDHSAQHACTCLHTRSDGGFRLVVPVDPIVGLLGPDQGEDRAFRAVGEGVRTRGSPDGQSDCASCVGWDRDGSLGDDKVGARSKAESEACGGARGGAAGSSPKHLPVGSRSAVMATTIAQGVAWWETPRQGDRPEPVGGVVTSTPATLRDQADVSRSRMWRSHRSIVLVCEDSDGSGGGCWRQRRP